MLQVLRLGPRFETSARRQIPKPGVEFPYSGVHLPVTEPSSDPKAGDVPHNSDVLQIHPL